MEEVSSGDDLTGAGEHGSGPEDHDSSDDYASTGECSHGGASTDHGTGSDDSMEEDAVDVDGDGELGGDSMEIDQGSGEEPSGDGDQGEASDVGANGVDNGPIPSSSSNNDEPSEENGVPAANGAHGPPLSSGSSNADSSDEPNQDPLGNGVVANGNSAREHPQAPDGGPAAVAVDDDEDAMVDITGSSSQGTSSQSGKDSSETSSSGDGTSSSGANTTSSDDTVKMAGLDAQAQVPSSSDAADTSTSSGAKAAASDNADSLTESMSIGSLAELLEREIPAKEDLDAQAPVPSSADAADILASSGANAADCDDDTESLSESLVEFAELLERELLLAMED